MDQNVPIPEPIPKPKNVSKEEAHLMSDSDPDSEFIDSTQLLASDFEAELLKEDALSQEQLLQETNPSQTQAEEERLPKIQQSSKAKTKRKQDKAIDPTRVSQVLLKPSRNHKK